MSPFDPLNPEMWLFAAVIVLWFSPTIVLKLEREPVVGFFWLNLLFGWIPFVWVGLALHAGLLARRNRAHPGRWT